MARRAASNKDSAANNPGLCETRYANGEVQLFNEHALDFVKNCAAAERSPGSTSRSVQHPFRAAA
jgi:hypothetical protein